MLTRVENQDFEPINSGFNSVFRKNRLSIGLVVPLESYSRSPVPEMKQHLERVQLAERLGFSAVWLRDVPFNVPSFGDAGQIFDPFVYLGFLAAGTRSIALGVASIVLPLRHPAHVAKAAASVDQLSGGRLILGVASGDRPEEFPAMNQPFEARGERFRESFGYIRKMAVTGASFSSCYGSPSFGMDMLPKTTGGRLPLLVTGGSRQHPDWTAEHADGWMTYPRELPAQQRVISEWRDRLAEMGQPDKPVLQPLYVDLAPDPGAPPRPIHLGMRLGVRYLKSYLNGLRTIGINHVALNLRFNEADIEDTLNRLGDDLLPEFHS